MRQLHLKFAERRDGLGVTRAFRRGRGPRLSPAGARVLGPHRAGAEALAGALPRGEARAASPWLFRATRCAHGGLASVPLTAARGRGTRDARGAVGLGLAVAVAPGATRWSLMRLSRPPTNGTGSRPRPWL